MFANGLRFTKWPWLRKCTGLTACDLLGGKARSLGVDCANLGDDLEGEVRGEDMGFRSGPKSDGARAADVGVVGEFGGLTVEYRVKGRQSLSSNRRSFLSGKNLLASSLNSPGNGIASIIVSRPHISSPFS